MNEKCRLCPHYNPKSYECEADSETDTCLVDAVEAFKNKLMLVDAVEAFINKLMEEE